MGQLAGWLVCLRVAVPVVRVNGTAPGTPYPRPLDLPVVWVTPWLWEVGMGCPQTTPVG